MAAAFAIEEIQAYKLVTYACYFCYLKLSKQALRHSGDYGKSGKNCAKKASSRAKEDEY